MIEFGSLTVMTQVPFELAHAPHMESTSVGRVRRSARSRRRRLLAYMFHSIERINSC